MFSKPSDAVVVVIMSPCLPTRLRLITRMQKGHALKNSVLGDTQKDQPIDHTKKLAVESPKGELTAPE